MTTTHRQRTFYETVAQSNAEALQARNGQLKRTIADLLDTQAAMVPLPTLEIVRALEHVQYHNCLNDASAAWLRDVKEKMG